MDIIKVFGTNLRNYRTALGLSQESFAEKCGLHRTYISSAERFQRNISIENVQRIADALEIEAYKLFLESENVEWEMKSINLDTSASGFSTNHHTTHDIIAKYRQVPWSFSIYHGITLEEIYAMASKTLEPLYQKWEHMLQSATHLNNPKIPVAFVRKNGKKVYPIDPGNPIDPDSIHF